MKRIGIVGSSGSIGRQTVDIIARHRGMFDVKFITVHSNHSLGAEQAALIESDHLFVTGNDGMKDVLSAIDAEDLDLLVVATVGASGIEPAYCAAGRGVDIALANKECIVAAGRIILARAAKSGAKIIPVDSEHSAIYQCLMGQDKDYLDKIILTASGGPFRDHSIQSLADVSVADALKHPNWDMGSKITIDSATMMNKGLELIEARYLFDVPFEKLSVVIHPESIIHSVVSFCDGSMLAQLGEPDMRTPISFALGFPARIPSGVKPIDLTEGLSLNMYKPDLTKYKCLALALEVLKNDKNIWMIALNAANEIAVAAFLENKIPFLEIADVVERATFSFAAGDVSDISEIYEVDAAARHRTKDIIEGVY